MASDEVSAAACEDPEGIPSSLKDDRCEICGSPMVEIHCKLRCPNCGRMRDCSDP
ncbi:hypothetical protein [Thermoflexus sp.]|uniref:hypothetical protein n=1 Tax=Thermoflexus sp. TaxID=1969742 RepID=UPI002629C7AE|nr:hypothetical protein [Thermoflexus sp.]MDT7949651.1 hypothetical protein [Thermoflexus sp.]